MIHRRGRGSENKTGGRIAAVDCPVCACPNRPGASKCMYCGSALPKVGAAMFNLPNFDGIKKFFDEATGKKRSPLWRITCSALLSTLLFAIGTYFLFRAVKHGGYLTWATVILLGFYAGALLRSAYQVLFGRKN